MTNFGDFDDDDAYDTASPDPEQVARKFALYNGEVWDDLPELYRANRVATFVKLLAWLRRQGGIR